VQRGINEFQMGYQPITNLLQDRNGDLLADSNHILNRRKNYFSHLLNVRVYRASDVPAPSPFVAKIVIEKLKGKNRQAVMKSREN
jgi:hypothetical protein